MTTILPAKTIKDLVNLKEQLARFPGDLYVVGAEARAANSELEIQCFQLANALTVARVKLDNIILLAAAERSPNP